MKILCVIDSLGSGGAQRQLVNLALGLKGRGHQVEFFVYFPEYRFFFDQLESAGIVVHSVRKRGRMGLNVAVCLAKLIRRRNFETAISFLQTPSFYCAIAKVLAPRFSLIVGERNSSAADANAVLSAIIRLSYVVADRVVANSEDHAAWLRKWPWLKNRTAAIYNGYATLSSGDPKPVSNGNELRLLVVGRVTNQKNGLRLIEALALHQQNFGWVPSVSWAGRWDPEGESARYFEAMEQLLSQNPEVRSRWRWLGERSDIPALLREHDALLHPSLYEGLPNAVCEALMVGRPVIVSNVCDHPILVAAPVRGLLCDPLSPASICAAIRDFASTKLAEREAMGINARAFAVENLTLDRMIDAYEKQIRSCESVWSKY